MIAKKICMLGASSVGKTSLVRRFVDGSFSDRYLTTVGVKLDKKDVQVDGQDVRLVLWDLSGEDEFTQLRTSYLRGASGCLLVVDPTRPDTLEKVRELRAKAVEALGDDIPTLTLFNKADLRAEWRVEADPEAIETSAKTGDRVEDAFEILARRTIS